MVAELSTTATWSFVDGCRAIRSSYLVTCGWMLYYLASPTLTLAWMFFFFSRHNQWCLVVEVQHPPEPHVFLLFVCLWDFTSNHRIIYESMYPCSGLSLALPLNEKRVKTRL